MTGIIRLGVAERGSFKKIFGSGAYPVLQRLLAYSEFTVHMQNHLKAGSFVGTKSGLSHDVQFFFNARAMK